MSTKLEKLDRNNWESLHNLATIMYLDRQCYEFAAALNQGLGWEMKGLMTGSIVEPVIRHVLVRSPYGKLRDERGIVSETDIGKPFEINKIILRSVTLEDLRKVRPVYDEAIQQASIKAQALWPELPWNENTFHGKTLAFMNDLEAICRKHGVWIRAPYPMAQIILDKAYGDEGFRISPSLTGQYLFDRVI